MAISLSFTKHTLIQKTLCSSQNTLITQNTLGSKPLCCTNTFWNIKVSLRANTLRACVLIQLPAHLEPRATDSRLRALLAVMLHM